MRLLIPIFILCAVTLSKAQDKHATQMKDCKLCPANSEEHFRPYEMKFVRELPYVGVGIALSGIATLAEYNNTVLPFTEEDLLLLNKNNVPAIDRGATNNWSPRAHQASNILISTATFLPVLFFMNHHTRADLVPLSVMSVEVLLINFGITILTKNLINRARPLTYNPNVPLEERINATSRESFFSGHTSHTTAASFFFAKVVTDYHPNMSKGLRIGIWTTMATLPAVTAFLRVKAGKHFASDVMVGYVVGGAIGYLVPYLHKTRDHNHDSKVQLFPSLSPTHTGVGIRIRI